MRLPIAAVAASMAWLLLFACSGPRDEAAAAFDEIAKDMWGPDYTDSEPTTFRGYLTIGLEARAFYPYRGDIGESIRSEPHPLSYRLLDLPSLADTPGERALLRRMETSLDHAEYEVRFRGRRLRGQHSCVDRGYGEAVLIDTLLEVRDVTMPRERSQTPNVRTE